MNERTPDFSELIGEDVSPDERARLEQAHRMIVESGPLPELPLALQKAPAVDDRTTRRWRSPSCRGAAAGSSRSLPDSRCCA